MKKQNFDIIVIGAGASGLLAAGAAAEGGARVLLLEKMERPARKLLITGKGRCNITNQSYQSEFIKHVHPGGKYLKKVFSQFYTEDMIALLEKCGVSVKTERGSRVFPESDKAATVVEGLLEWVKAQGVRIKVNGSVKQLMLAPEKVAGVKAIVDSKETWFDAERVIIATGGKSYPATGSTGDGYHLAAQAGHTIIPVRPSLVPVTFSGSLQKRLEGIALKNVTASVWVDGRKDKDDFGEMVFTADGVSGPIILTLSRNIVDALEARKNVRLSIDLKPALDDLKLDHRLQRDLDAEGKKSLKNIFKLWLPSALIPFFLEKLQIDASKNGHQVTGAERKQIRLMMKNMVFDITGYRPFKEAIITAGGVDTREINASTMESKLIKGLYFAGEVLNLDGDTGGYNLQIAWSTGWVAGYNAARSL